MVTPAAERQESRRAVGAQVRSHRLVAVIEIEDVPDLVDPVVIAAFEGWNDAADAASSVIDHLIKVWGARIIGAIDPEDFYDFQVNRPLVGTDERGHRTDHLAEHPDRDRQPARPAPRRHPDPRHRAQHALAAVLRRAARRCRRPRRPDRGHPRARCWPTPRTPARSRSPAPPPSPSSSTGSSSRCRRTKARPASSASSRTPAPGSTSPRCPTGPPCPHYVAQPPCPKATLALLGRIEDLLEVSIPLGDLPEDARAWERGVDELAEEDEDIAEYVRSLEETRDTTELPEASGEAIAREFERYLKRRGDEQS